ncbi:hypothetical protein LX32DRAFT_194933 [Colletotrichum zoysiae]|uniref:Uncharacterized protein n=1 Tax=Colletotrichum zoysiae TaxID=1216348 RepID=A0AAD9LVR9_9PEZI|nr:hypothetical protein LX32DRAFT_194933 [Colletotrichum zoysiae]
MIASQHRIDDSGYQAVDKRGLKQQVRQTITCKVGAQKGRAEMTGIDLFLHIRNVQNMHIVQKGQLHAQGGSRRLQPPVGMWSLTSSLLATASGGWAASCRSSTSLLVRMRTDTTLEPASNSTSNQSAYPRFATSAYCHQNSLSALLFVHSSARSLIDFGPCAPKVSDHCCSNHRPC